MSCQYRPESLLLGAGTSLLEREDSHLWFDLHGGEMPVMPS